MVWGCIKTTEDWEGYCKAISSKALQQMNGLVQIQIKLRTVARNPFLNVDNLAEMY